jgi:hypothetical protein
MNEKKKKRKKMIALDRIDLISNLLKSSCIDNPRMFGNVGQSVFLKN